METGGVGSEAQAEDGANAFEITEDALEPVLIKMLAIPGARFVLGGPGEFVDVIDGGFDHLGHRGQL
jgi:hypothetical protein